VCGGGPLNDKAEAAPEAGRNALFRGAALERLHSPELLDQRIAVIPPAMRVMAAAAAVIVVAGLIWAVLGSIPTRVSGQGILLADGEAGFAVEPTSSGPLVELLVKPGDSVKVGDAIARVAQASLGAQLDSAKARVATLQGDLVRLKAADAAEVAKSDDNARRQQEAIDGQISAGKARIARLSSLLAGYENLLAKGIMSRVEVVSMQQQYDQTVLDVATAAAKKIEVEATAAQKHDDLAERERVKQAEIEVVQADVARLQAEFTIGSTVRAPIAGLIEEIRSGRGDVVSPGTVLATIGTAAPKHFEVVALIASDMVKRVAPGMDVHVMPATVKKEEHGSMRGRVVSVSTRGVSTGEVNAILRNPDLTKSLMGDASPLLVRIAVFDTKENPSGFTWWTGQGPKFEVRRGTRTAVDIIVETNPPIALVIPALRKLLGLEG
jgi:HlyD family secretion protein